MAEGKLKCQWSQTSDIVAAVYNTVRDAKKRSKPFSGDDFNPTKRRGKRPKASIADFRALMGKRYAGQ